MTSTTILSEDTATIVSDDQGRSFNWGAVIAGAIAAAAVIFFLSTLGSGIGLAYAAHDGATGTRSFLTLAAIYFFASQAFGFTVGGYLVGRLIGPETETTREEEFRSAAHGFVMWSLVVVVSLLLAGFAGTDVPAVGATATQASDVAAKAAFDLWTALALLFGAIVAVAAAISARWMDDKVSFSWERRAR